MSDRRLTKSDWLRRGLLTLATEGPGGLKVGPMAAKLKVSRGSFYWHFEGMADFRAQLLRAWQESTTDQVIRELEAHPNDPGRLKDLMRRTFAVKRRLDRAVRAWAIEDAEVAATVQAVDARRVASLADLLVGAGVEAGRARDRATFLYWAYLGQAVVMSPVEASMPLSALDDISDLFES